LILFLIAGTGLFAADAQQPRTAENANKSAPGAVTRPFTNVEMVAALRSYGAVVTNIEDPLAVQPAAAIRCDVEDKGGLVTHSVHPAQYPLTAAYWARYQPASGSPTITSVRFTIAPMFAGSPLSAQVQLYVPNSTNEVLAPFAIPFWGGGLTNGNWSLVVKDSTGASCQFNFLVQ
jgi:hypothetical protein